MRESEIKLLQLLRDYYQNTDSSLGTNTTYLQKINLRFEELQNDPIGSVSLEFLQDSFCKKFLISPDAKDEMNVWHFIQTHDLNTIEAHISALRQSENKEDFNLITTYYPRLIQTIYLSNNQPLIDLFKKYYPIPRKDFFQNETEIPHDIAMREKLKENSIQNLQTINPHKSFQEITNDIIKIQRAYRAHARYQSEVLRINRLWLREIRSANHKLQAEVSCFTDLLSAIFFPTERAKRIDAKKITAQKLIHDSNKPYLPKCSNKHLARRLIIAAQKTRLFTTVKHWTHQDALVSIFNDALYGRYTLMQNYKKFRPAALGSRDIEQGDMNVICCAPNEIDPNAMKPDTVELLFELEKMSQKNPVVFFKQRDLVFELARNRQVNFGKGKSITFDHTGKLHSFRHSILTLFEGNEAIATSSLPNYSLISYNVQEMHQILTLNFFRFLDQLRDMSGSIFTEKINQIYTDLDELSPQELDACIENIAKALSDTSEFNFYGAHRIDFSTIIEISSYKNGKTKSYTLKIQDLIDDLQNNQTSILQEAQAHFPSAFRSERFINYLLSKVDSEPGQLLLNTLLTECTSTHSPNQHK